MIKCSFLIDERIFPREVLFKAAYLFTSEYYIHMSYQEEYRIQIVVEAKPGVVIDDIDKKFCNELLAQMVRYQVSNENKTLRELVVGRALYSSYIDFSENFVIVERNESQRENQNYSLEDIAVDWFEENEEENCKI